jgi:hypothetical protein
VAAFLNQERTRTNINRHPPLERSGMRGTHEHLSAPVFMGGPNESGHDDFVSGSANSETDRDRFLPEAC